jgi:hypothetical protein
MVQLVSGRRTSLGRAVWQLGVREGRCIIKYILSFVRTSAEGHGDVACHISKPIVSQRGHLFEAARKPL